MKNLLKIVLTTFLGICVFCAVGCNNNAKTNDVSITALETELKKSNSNFKFTVNESSSGFTFRCVNNYATYSGTADEKQNVTDITFVYNNISNDVITNKNQIKKAMTRLLNDPGSLTIEEIYAVGCVIDFESLQSVFGVESNLDTAVDIICENKTTEINGWSVSVKSSESTVTITANKK